MNLPMSIILRDGHKYIIVVSVLVYGGARVNRMKVRVLQLWAHFVLLKGAKKLDF